VLTSAAIYQPSVPFFVHIPDQAVSFLNIRASLSLSLSLPLSLPLSLAVSFVLSYLYQYGVRQFSISTIFRLRLGA
jgi:hypothetical protein